jgi:starch phosphorylase
MSFRAIRTKPLARLELPVQFSRLRDIAYNLWWSWSPSAQSLFEMLDQETWQRYRSPIEVLIDLEPTRWHQLQKDAQFIQAYRELVDDFDSYMVPRQPSWFERSHKAESDTVIAYFSTEYGWHESLPSYSGGLGILSGDHSKTASDLGLPFVGIGLLYRRGYFRQTVDSEGQQQHFYPDYDVLRLPLQPVIGRTDKELRVTVKLPTREVTLRVWKANVGRIPVLLLDCDLPCNHPADRTITSTLYTSGREMRLCQEMILGLGGARVLQALDIEPTVWHLNEGHSALLTLERIDDLLKNRRLSLQEALSLTAANTIFTTHTPVPAGNESFDAGLIRKFFSNWAERTGIDIEQVLALGRSGKEEESGSFNMTALALRTSCKVNGVSKLHGEMASTMWEHLPELTQEPKIGHVTNGVHLPTWIGPHIGETLAAHRGIDFADTLAEPGFAEAVEQIPDAQLWEAHLNQKKELLSLTRERLLLQLSRHGSSPDELVRLDRLLHPDGLLIGFARRFATYKRADLILRDLEQIKAIVLDADRPVQFLFAGKAHPADKPGQDLIRHIFQASRTPELRDRLIFLENYDIKIGRGMVQGVDVWLNNPRRPLEASGTSGMKAAMNGALNLSVLDGWWDEGYDAAHGWAIGENRDYENEDAEDHSDAEAIYRLLRDEIVPCYYDRDESGLPVAWIGRMKQAIGRLTPRFSTDRMVREYTENYYLKVNGKSA